MCTRKVCGCPGLVYQFGDWLLYHPEQPPHSRLYVPSPTLVGLPCWEAPPVHTRDGLRLHALFVRQPPERFGQAPTLLYLHGNAGNIGHRSVSGDEPVSLGFLRTRKLQCQSFSLLAGRPNRSLQCCRLLVFFVCA